MAMSASNVGIHPRVVVASNLRNQPCFGRSPAMLTRVIRWAIAAAIGSAFAAVGCSAPRPAPPRTTDYQRPVLADDSVVHALDIDLETRLVDRLELDNFLRDRDIRVHVVDGVVEITGDVWTPLEKERVGELVRRVAGMIDVSNDLAVHSPRD